MNRPHFQSPITRLLSQASDGDSQARDRLWQLVYDELRQIARQRHHHAPTVNFEPTALVHDLFVRMGAKSIPSFQNRSEFYRAAASAMRNVLVEESRRRSRLKRGGNLQRITLSDVVTDAEESCHDVVDLDIALTRLGRSHPRVVEIIELRFFCWIDERGIRRRDGPLGRDRRARLELWQGLAAPRDPADPRGCTMIF